MTHMKEMLLTIQLFLSEKDRFTLHQRCFRSKGHYLKSAGSFHHALVGRPFKRKIKIPNGDYQFYHWYVARYFVLIQRD